MVWRNISLTSFKVLSPLLIIESRLFSVLFCGKTWNAATLQWEWMTTLRLHYTPTPTNMTLWSFLPLEYSFAIKQSHWWFCARTTRSLCLQVRGWCCSTFSILTTLFSSSCNCVRHQKVSSSYRSCTGIHSNLDKGLFVCTRIYWSSQWFHALIWHWQILSLTLLPTPASPNGLQVLCSAFTGTQQSLVAEERLCMNQLC